MKKALLLLLALALCAGLLALSAMAADDFLINENGVLTKYNGPGGDVIIPPGVTSIGNQAFYNCRTLRSVTIPNGVTSIGTAAFADCSSLIKVTIPDSVNVIGSAAFDRCSSLTSVTIPDGVTKISYGMFRDCFGLASVTIPDSVTVLEGAVFYGCAGLTSITIPDGVEVIAHEVFRNCSSLTSVTIPNGVTTIESAAFRGCTGLGRVTIPAGVSEIGTAAFSGCIGLTAFEVVEENPQFKSVDGVLFSNDGTQLVAYPGAKKGGYAVPNGVTSIESYAFSNCNGLPAVSISFGVIEVGDAAFADCSGLTSITLPDSVTKLGWGAFKGCFGLTSITIPNSVTDIGEDAFRGCSGLTSMTIPEGITAIWPCSFSNCSGLTGITIPDSVTMIASAAFYGCSGLTSVTIPAGVELIDYSAFSGCTGLTGITIPAGVELLGASAFSGCTGMTSVNLPDSVTYIESDLFSGCSSLTAINIPSNVTGIDYNAFSGCTSLVSITIPASVTHISEGVFSNCSALASIDVAADNPNYKSIDGVLFTKDGTQLVAYPGAKQGEYVIPESVTRIEENAFAGCANLTGVTIPAGAVYNYYYLSAFSGCSALVTISVAEDNPKLKSIDGVLFSKDGTTLLVCPGAKKGAYAVPENVIDIGYYAFSGCSGLTSVTFPDGMSEIRDYAFSGCSGLTAISIPSSVTSIGYKAFSGCTSLASVTIPAGVTYISGGVFSNCSALASINAAADNPKYKSIDGVLFAKDGTQLVAYPGAKKGGYLVPDGTIIWSGSFSGCSGLTSITIPRSVSIYGSAFEDCDNLIDVYYGGSLFDWESNVETFRDYFPTNLPLHTATIHYFSNGPSQASATPKVKRSPQNLTVDGVSKEVDKYNIDGSNYFKLRDIAFLLNGTGSQFAVGWDAATKTVTIITGAAYEADGSELAIGEDKSDTTKPSPQTIVIDGDIRCDISAFNIGGNNFFKLRDLGNALSFDVDYDKATNTAIVESR